MKRLAGAIALAGGLAAAGCGELPSDGETLQGATTGTTVVSSDDILGFEKTPGWTWTSTGQRLSERRTVGLQSFALDAPAYETHLTSQKVSSTAKGLANLGDAGSQFALDIMLPEVFKTPTASSFVQLKVKSSARGLAQTDLGKIKLNDLPGGVFKTVKWAIPSAVRSKLAGVSYSDLIFDIYIHPFDCPSDTIRIDNLRVKSPSREPAGAGVSLDLIAQRTYGPEVSTPGEAHFPAGVVQIPQSFHVKLGKSGVATNTVKLELGYGTTIAYTCTYVAGNVGGAGKSYDFSKCTGGGKVGDLVSADFARLTIVKADATAGTTKIRAQLAGNPLGDETGRGVIPAIPTFWGDSPSEIDGIVDAYSAALNPTNKQRTEERFITLPTPEFALRHGDGAARDLLDPNLPPIPNDPPFSQAGHMNPGSGTWDAWWDLAGNLTYGDAGARHTSRLEANLGAHVLVWGFPVDIATMNLVVTTDNGHVTSTGYESPSSHGSLKMYLAGQLLPGSGDRDATTGFGYHIDESRSYDAPTIHVWIFAIQAGVTAGGQLTAVGDLRLDGFHVNVAPHLNIGAHLFGGIDLGIASGGVDVNIQFLDVSVPVDASVTWNVNTSPAVCAATLNFDLSSTLALSTLGGSVDLVAKFGICPFCDHERWRLFSWKGLSLGPPKPIFAFHETIAGAGLGDACKQPITVAISKPATGAHVFTGTKTTAVGTATRGAGPVPGGGIGVPTPVECNYWTWTTNGAGDSPATTTGCKPIFTWGSAGTRTVTLTVTNQYGETGTASSQVTVDGPPSYPVPSILSPADGEFYWSYEDISLLGTYVGGVEPVTLSWSYKYTGFPGGDETAIGTGPSLTWGGLWYDFRLTLTATDANGATGTDSVIIDADRPPR